jgi:hypothetical protein
MLVLIALLVATTAAAQSNQSPSTTHRGIKVMVGAAALAIGVAVAAKSSQTTTVTTIVGTSETSTFSTSQLVTGLAIAGTGGFLLWDGLRDHQPGPSTRVGIAVTNHSRGVFLRRSW